MILHELPLCRGDGRADVVAVNGAIKGYEIKSDCDSLARLQTQTALYDDTCHYVSIVLTARHLRRAVESVPASWGIYLARRLRGQRVRIKELRPAAHNCPELRVLIKQLWKTECLQLLRIAGRALDPRTSVRVIWQEMEKLPEAVLEPGVRLALRQRHQ